MSISNVMSMSFSNKYAFFCSYDSFKIVYWVEIISKKKILKTVVLNLYPFNHEQLEKYIQNIQFFWESFVLINRI